MRTISQLLLLLAVVTLPAQAKQIAGITLPDTLDASSVTLILNGAGVRSKMWMEIYAGGLYLKSKNSEAGKIVADDEPMAIKLHIVSGLVSSEAMEEATREGFENTTDGNTAPLADSINAFTAVFKEPIVEGDVFDIIHIPGKGIDIYKNGSFKSTVAGGLAFKEALFGIWLGDKPADKKLKQGMLGE